MAITKNPLQGSKMSQAELRKVMGGKSGLYEFLAMYATRDVQMHHFEFDDADGAALVSGEFWILEDSGGTGGENFAVTDVGGGYIQCDTGTGDNGSIGLFGKIMYLGDDQAGMEVRIQSDDVSEANIETGFTDAIEGSNASAVSDVDTPAAAATDLAVITYDTDQTATGLHFVTDGGTANQNVAATAFVTKTDMVDLTWHRFRVQLEDNYAAAWMDGKLEANHNAINTQVQGALEGGTALMPFVYCRTRAVAEQFVKVQYLTLWMDRSDVVA